MALEHEVHMQISLTFYLKTILASDTNTTSCNFLKVFCYGVCNHREHRLTKTLYHRILSSMKNNLALWPYLKGMFCEKRTS